MLRLDFLPLHIRIWWWARRYLKHLKKITFHRLMTMVTVRIDGESAKPMPVLISGLLMDFLPRIVQQAVLERSKHFENIVREKAETAIQMISEKLSRQGSKLERLQREWHDKQSRLEEIGDGLPIPEEPPAPQATKEQIRNGEKLRQHLADINRLWKKALINAEYHEIFHHRRVLNLCRRLINRRRKEGLLSSDDLTSQPSTPQSCTILTRKEAMRLTLRRMAQVSCLWNGLSALALSLVLATTSQAQLANTKIAFVNNRLSVANADGTSPIQLTTGSAGEPSWSPDGTKIAFHHLDDNVEIYVINADGSNLTRLTTAGGGQPTWSPDGTKIAFSSDRNGVLHHIYVMNADGTNQTQVTTGPADDNQPAWSPDGTKIAFASFRNGNWDIYVMMADGSDSDTPLRLTTDPAVDQGPEWSPDGTKIAFYSERGNGSADIYVMNAADGSNQTRLTDDSANDYNASWAPDGTMIVYESTRDGGGTSTIYVMNPDGSDQTRIITPPGTPPGIDSQPAWSPFLPPVLPFLSLSTTSLAFGNVEVGEMSSLVLTISNTGSATLFISNMTITGTDAGLFTVDQTNFSVAVGNSHDVTVTFAPTSAGDKHATLRLTHNAADSPTDIPLTGRGIRVTLKFKNAFAKPGSPAVVSVTLDASIAIAGLELKLHPQVGGNPTTDAHFNGVINALLDDGFTASDATHDGVTTILLFSTSGAQIPPGEILLMQLVYDIDPAASNGEAIDLAVSEDVLSDPLSHEVPHVVEAAKLYVGQPGDVAGGSLNLGDGSINILDIIKLVGCILNILPPPEPFTFSFFVADINGDGRLDILDIVAMVNAILYHDGQPKALADGPTGPVTVNLGEVQALESGQVVVPVTITTDGVIAGAQATFTFDGAQLKLGTPQAVGRASGMTVQSHVKDGQLQVVVYSASGQGISAGSGTTLLVPVTVTGGPEAAPTLTLAQVVLANRQAQAVPAVLGTSTVKVQPLPTAFALKSNRPNPFNPTTRIAYEVPRPAHVALVVYNLLGQEVVRLVDEVKTPGRYEVTWDGRNGQGQGVASGVYLYRLTTSAGFSQIRRMTLVK